MRIALIDIHYPYADSTHMNPILFIRKNVFRSKQAAFAQIIGVGQASVSRWENDETSPTLNDMRAIRDAAAERDLQWNDGWFFVVPPEPVPEAVAA